MSRIVTHKEARTLKVTVRHKITKGTSYSTKSGVYLILFDNGIKIGMAENINERLKVYDKPWCREIKEMVIYNTANPKYLEKMLKEHFRLAIKSFNSTEFISLNSLNPLIDLIEANRMFKK